MTTPIGVWQISGEEPIRVAPSKVGLERNLEDWIERDPSLLQQGLVIVARQLVIEGGRLDLLALDQQARLNVIEIKAGRVRRDTVAQAIDYASVLAMMSERELASRINSYCAAHPLPGGEQSTKPRTYSALASGRSDRPDARLGLNR